MIKIINNMKVTIISNACIDLVKSFEGFFSKPYLCPANVPTIGYGTILYPNGKKVTLKDYPCTEAQAVEWMRFELNQKAKEVDAMTSDAVTQHQFDALVSFAYNCGSGALKGSTLLKRVNANPSDPTIIDAFLMWTKADGKTLNGLVRRRKAEAKLYFS
jgi:lysozyme